MVFAMEKEGVSVELRRAQQAWAAGIQNFHIARWEELPDLELYMDQVITFLNRHLAPLLEEDRELVTAAMVNNYVKQGLIPKPEKKKYTRRHVAYLMTITILKQVLTITEIRDGIVLYTRQMGTAQRSYDHFCEEMELALGLVCNQLTNAEPHLDRLEVPPAELVMLRMAATSFVCKLAARKAMALQTNWLKQEEAKT